MPAPRRRRVRTVAILFWRPKPGEKVERYVVYLMKEASTWWASDLGGFWKGEDERFLLGCAIVPAGGEAVIGIQDRNDPPGWKAAYVFKDVGGKRVPIAPEEVTVGAAPAGAALAEVPAGYAPR